MDLVRFALFKTHIAWPNENWGSFCLKSDAAEVSSFSSWESKGKIDILVGMSAEAAIEAAASYISVFSGSSCRIWSPRLPVAFHSSSAHHLERLRRAKGLADGAVFMPGDTFAVSIDPGLISSLSDREDGVALLAGALATSDLAGTYRELLRVFERAFAC